MFPSRDPFNSDMDSYIRNLLGAENPIYENTVQIPLDQESDGETLTVTMDISTYDKNSVRIHVQTNDNVSKLILHINERGRHGMQSFKNIITLKDVVDDSSAKAVENNGILTITFDVVDSQNITIE